MTDHKPISQTLVKFRGSVIWFKHSEFNDTTQLHHHYLKSYYKNGTWGRADAVKMCALKVSLVFAYICQLTKYWTTVQQNPCCVRKKKAILV